MRARLTYSNVVSSVCLFVLLGGGAYAASRLPANSVGSRQLRRNSVNTLKVRDGSLRARDFAAGQLPAGSIGPTGPAGADGVNDLRPGFGVYRDAPVALTASPSATSVATLSNLPGGSYLITAKTVITATAISTDPTTCTLVAPATGGAGGDSDTVAVQTGNGGTFPDYGDSHDEVISLQVLHQFSAAGGTARVQCSHTYSGVTGISAANTKIAAVPLTSITNSPVAG